MHMPLYGRWRSVGKWMGMIGSSSLPREAKPFIEKANACYLLAFGAGFGVWRSGRRDGGIMATRTYTKTKRANKEQQTHRRIIDAALVLYGSVGPAATTISAVATKASVQRLTVYRHFPKETDLMAGALKAWFDSRPMPDPTEWRDGVDPQDWPIAILSMLYNYYSETSNVWARLQADRAKHDDLEKLMQPANARLAVIQDDILRHLPTGRRDNVLCRAVVAHSVQFSTWKSLTDSALDTVEVAALMEDWVRHCPLS